MSDLPFFAKQPMELAVIYQIPQIELNLEHFDSTDSNYSSFSFFMKFFATFVFS